MKQAAERLKQAVSAGVFLTDEPMSRHTTFRTGGPADIYIEPSCAEELKQVLDICREENLAYTIIGNGSNLLVGDKGYRGVLISFGKPFGQVAVEGTQVRAGAGALLSVVAKQALNASLTGFEFAAGIPGTIGGAVVMNAGAYGGELCQVLKEATVLTPESEVRILPAAELELGYRTSCVQKNGYINGIHIYNHGSACWRNTYRICHCLSGLWLILSDGTSCIGQNTYACNQSGNRSYQYRLQPDRQQLYERYT